MQSGVAHLGFVGLGSIVGVARLVFRVRDNSGEFVLGHPGREILKAQHLNPKTLNPKP